LGGPFFYLGCFVIFLGNVEQSEIIRPCLHRSAVVSAP